MRFLAFSALSLLLGVVPASAASIDAAIKDLAPHRAVYDIKLTASHSGSQILNISGKMTYEWRPSCDAWVTDHHFELSYQYADAPGMRIKSDFSTYESLDSKDFHFSSRRSRDGEMYQEIRGSSSLNGAKAGKAVFSMPPGLYYDLTRGTLYPMFHTIEVVRHADAGDKVFSANVFDGSDEDGPVEINTVIGKKTKAPESLTKNKSIDTSLLQGDAWRMRMAVFPMKDDSGESDYEMGMVFHRNGIISDMDIDYDDFSVKQKLVSLEKLPGNGCDAQKDAVQKP